MTDQATAETTARHPCYSCPAWSGSRPATEAEWLQRGQDRQLSLRPGAELGSGRARLSDMIRPCVLHTFSTRSPCNLRASGVSMFVLLACNFDNARWQPAQDDLLLAKCLLNPDKTLLASELVDQQPDD